MSEFLVLLGEDNGVTSRWIIGGMATAIVALSGYIVRLHTKMNSDQEAMLKQLQDQFDLLKTLRKEFDK